MKLGQIIWNGRITAAVWDAAGLAHPIPDTTMQDLIRRSEVEKIELAELAARQAAKHGENVSAVIPIHPREVWACGCTYEMSAAFRDAEHNTREGFYAYVTAVNIGPKAFSREQRGCAWARGRRLGFGRTPSSRRRSRSLP